MLDEQSTGTTTEQPTDFAPRSRPGTAARTAPAPHTPGGPALPAELSALAQRVATARGKLPLQADPALLAELSDREITAERELAEWIRNQRRQQRKRAVSAELTAEKRGRRVALALRRADESDVRWHRRARAARMRVSNSDARLAQLFRRAEWSSRALIGVVILGMVWAGVNVQHNLVPSGDMSDPLYWLSYGFEAMISIPIITIMVVATTAARWGREIDRGKVVFLETALLGVTIALNAGPHLMGGEPARAAEAAVAPVMVGVVIWLHSWVSARYAQLIDDIPVEEIDADDPRPSGYRPSYRPDNIAAWAEQDALPGGDPDFHSYPQPTQMLTPAELPQYESSGASQWNTSVPQANSENSPLRVDKSEPTDSVPTSESSVIADNSPTAPATTIADTTGPQMSVTAAPIPEYAQRESVSVSSPAAPPIAATPLRHTRPSAESPSTPTAQTSSSTQGSGAPANTTPDANTPAVPAVSSSAPDDPPEETEHSPRRAGQRPAPGTPLHIVSGEPRRTRTRRAVDDAVQLVLGEPLAESPRTARPAPPKTVAADAAADPNDRPGGNPGTAVPDDQAGPDAEFEPPDLTDDEFEADDIEAATDDHTEAEGGELAIWSVAREIRKRGLSKLPVEQLAEILTLTDESWTPAAIGAAVGLPGSRILGILETARRISMPLAVGG